MIKENEHSNILTFKVTDDLLRKINQKSKTLKITRSDLIREALTTFIDDENKK
jgi:metal-responsive CopG/Arc/MetJ family transcriptional regulator